MPDYPANTLFCNNWFYGPIMALVPVVQTGLWCSLDRTSALASCDNFATYMLFCGFYEEGCSVIKQLLVARGAASKPDNPKRLMLEAVWSRRPDLRFEVAGWPAPLSTAETERWRIANREAICTREDTSFVKESHEWRHSSEPRVAEACGRILSRPVDGKWPQEEANREALAAIEKHRALCDASKNVFPWASLTLEIGVALKIGADAARGVLERILSAPIEDHGDYFWMADSLCFDEDIAIVSSSLPAGLLGPSKADSGAACEAIVAALKQMVEHTGSLPVPLAGVAWKELLDRFAIAAYEVFDDEYVDIDSWEAILSPPASEEEIRKMNGQFKGLLPDDYKEMIALHNGYVLKKNHTHTRTQTHAIHTPCFNKKTTTASKPQTGATTTSAAFPRYAMPRSRTQPKSSPAS